jgi:hypothetical protein
MKRRKHSLEEKCAWMRERQKDTASTGHANPIPINEGSATCATVSELEGIEPTLDFKQIMALYGWKYHKVYRYFIDHPRLGVKFKYKPGKRPKRSYDVPVSVVKAEWDMMHSVNRHKADEWERLHPYQRPA